MRLFEFNLKSFESNDYELFYFGVLNIGVKKII